VKRLRIGVIYGGRSGEHEISIASAAAVVSNLDRDRYEADPLYIDRDGRWTIADRAPVAASAADRVLCLPIYPALQPDEQQRVIDLIRET